MSLNGVAAEIAAVAIRYWADRVKFGRNMAYIIDAGDDGDEMDAALRRISTTQLDAHESTQKNYARLWWTELSATRQMDPPWLR